MAFELGDDSEARSNFKGLLLGLRQALNIESPLKMVKNAFYFILKALFVLEIFIMISNVVPTFWFGGLGPKSFSFTNLPQL